MRVHMLTIYRPFSIFHEFSNSPRDPLFDKIVVTSKDPYAPPSRRRCRRVGELYSNRI